MNDFDNTVPLDAYCLACQSRLVLADGGRDHLVMCPLCDCQDGEGATPADALENWHQKHMPPPPVLTELASFVVPRQPSWVLTVDGYPFTSLGDAEEFARGKQAPIYCRLASSQKAANQ
jgi:hypothetical protein